MKIIKKNTNKKRKIHKLNRKRCTTKNKLNRRHVMRGGNNSKSKYDEITTEITKQIGKDGDIKGFIYKDNNDDEYIAKNGVYNFLTLPEVNFAKAFLPNLYALILNIYNINKQPSVILEFLTTETAYIFKLYLILYIINQEDCNIRDVLNNCILPIFNFHISIESDILKLIEKKPNMTDEDKFKMAITLIQNFIDKFNINYNVVQNYILVLIIKTHILVNKRKTLEKYGIEFDKSNKFNFDKDPTLLDFNGDLLITMFQRILKYEALFDGVIKYIKKNTINLDLTTLKNTLTQKIKNINESTSCKKALCMIKYMDYVINENAPLKRRTSILKRTSNVLRRLSTLSLTSLPENIEENTDSAISNKQMTRKMSKKIKSINTIDQIIEEQNTNKPEREIKENDREQKKYDASIENDYYCTNLDKDCESLDLEYILESLKVLIFKIFEIKGIKINDDIKSNLEKYVKSKSIKPSGIIFNITIFDNKFEIEYSLLKNGKYAIESFGFYNTNLNDYKSMIFDDENGGVYILSNDNTFKHLSNSEINYYQNAFYGKPVKVKIPSEHEISHNLFKYINNSTIDINTNENKANIYYLISGNSVFRYYLDTRKIIKFVDADIGKSIDIYDDGENKYITYNITKINTDGSVELDKSYIGTNKFAAFKSSIGDKYQLYNNGTYIIKDKWRSESYKYESIILDDKENDEIKGKFILKEDKTYEYFLRDNIEYDRDSSAVTSTNDKIYYLILKDYRIFKYNFNSKKIIKFTETDKSTTITIYDDSLKMNVDYSIESINYDGSAQLSTTLPEIKYHTEKSITLHGVNYLLLSNGNYQMSGDNYLKSVILDNDKDTGKFILKDDNTYTYLPPKDILYNKKSRDEDPKNPAYKNVINSTFEFKKSILYYLITNNNILYRYFSISREIAKFNDTDIGNRIIIKDKLKKTIIYRIESINDDGSANIEKLEPTAINNSSSNA